MTTTRAQTSGPWCIPQAYNDTKTLMWANARLIAAAPEMLDALRELCADTYLADPINADRMSKARAAIAKAEGRVA